MAAASFGWFPGYLLGHGVLKPFVDDGIDPLGLFANAQGRGELAGFDEFFEGALADAQALDDFGFGEQGDVRHAD